MLLGQYNYMILNVFICPLCKGGELLYKMVYFMIK